MLVIFRSTASGNHGGQHLAQNPQKPLNNLSMRSKNECKSEAKENSQIACDQQLFSIEWTQVCKI